MSSEQKTILSLFDYSGNWSKPYREAGYKVIQIDIKLGLDIYNFEPTGDIHGILAAPPCTDFAVSGARWFHEKDRDGRTAQSIRLIKHALNIIETCRPKWWALENPVGRLNRLIPVLREFGPRYFQPWWYGDTYSKKTGLWGVFTLPEPTSVVEPVEGSKMWKLYGGKSERTKELRSVTPLKFAYAFFNANK